MKKKTLILSYIVFSIIAILIILFGINLFQNKFNKVQINKNDINNFKYAILTFDDGWKSQYTVFEKLKLLNIKGTLYICSGLINQKDRLTLDNLHEIYDNGWDISNHTVHHYNLTTIDHDKVYDEIKGCSQWIASHGFTRNACYKHFAYPEGFYNDDIINILKEQKFLTARTTNAGNNINDYFQLGRTSLYGMSKENIRKTIFSNQKVLILCFHRIIPDNSSKFTEIDLSYSNFQEVIKDIINSKRKVVTMTEWYKLNNK